MERNDFGTNGAIDDVSFDRGTGSAGTAATASAGTSEIAGSASPAADGASVASSASIEPIETGRLNAAKQKLGVAKEKVVDRMHATADWIKEKDIDALKGGIEQQVKDHPGRTLLIAVGLGYLIGRAFRGGNSA